MDGLDVQNTVFYVYVLLMHVDILANLLGSSGNIEAQLGLYRYRNSTTRPIVEQSKDA